MGTRLLYLIKSTAEHAYLTNIVGLIGDVVLVQLSSTHPSRCMWPTRCIPIWRLWTIWGCIFRLCNPFVCMALRQISHTHTPNTVSFLFLRLFSVSRGDQSPRPPGTMSFN